MTIFDELGCQLTLDKENGELYNDDGECYIDAMDLPCIADVNATDGHQNLNLKPRKP